MGKVDDRDIYEIKRWLNDDKQNVDRLTEIVGSGGGGSSDFSTAEGTFNLTFPQGVTPDYIVITASFDYNENPYVTPDGVFVEDNKASLVLYEGKATLNSVLAYVGDTEYVVVRSSIVVTGNIEIPAIGNSIVTGDFTYSCNMVAH